MTRRWHTLLAARDGVAAMEFAITATALMMLTLGTIEFGRLLWLHNPRNFNTDLSLNKLIPIKDDVRIKLQGVFLNAFNHVAWFGGTQNPYTCSASTACVQSPTFGTTANASGPRQIELRANVQF